MSIPQSTSEAKLLISNTMVEAILSFQLNGDESQFELDETTQSTEDFVGQILESLQLNILSVNENYGIICTINPIEPSEFLFSD